MKAILIPQKGGAENLVLTDYPTPALQDGFVLVQIKAFGLNRAVLDELSEELPVHRD